ncbi:alpha/beta fold hydrolase [Arenimonas oryziterrae]|uniref:Uncharacterized protein n=1 Tax=Arenimonas oryziterrae DSM 21050 = YC6267 TaxID=1121015 RepID=A0A091ARK0_9GAMM|nr:alpha/beta fold hydrolase [Arenimonas oryziterrae]KFN42823.1 hypothetical protein N789_11880 [Arenimonas oryziterrae DSM 21050 = YC6267]
MTDYVLTTRRKRNGQYGDEPGPSSFLFVPPSKIPEPAHEAPSPDAWAREVRKAATWGVDARTGHPRGDVLVFVHGYNNSPDTIINRHRRLDTDLKAAGFKGVIVSYDWPSASSAFNYLEDRHDAKSTAMRLVSDGIALLAKLQTPDCSINIHILAHSMGAFVVREAFDDADDSKLARNDWLVSQVCFIAGDVSSGSMAADNATSDSLFRHCVRLTNYHNRNDGVLKLSNAKRLGVAPRVGRVGLPNDPNPRAIDVDCSAYFEKLNTDPVLKKKEQLAEAGSFEHSWFFGNQRFAKDLFETLRGDLSAQDIPTRLPGPKSWQTQLLPS